MIVASFAADMIMMSPMGVTLALQNHKPLIKDHRDVLRMVREVNSPHLKICLDAPLMPDKSAAAMREAHWDKNLLELIRRTSTDLPADVETALRYTAANAPDGGLVVTINLPLTTNGTNK